MTELRSSYALCQCGHVRGCHMGSNCLREDCSCPAFSAIPAVSPDVEKLWRLLDDIDTLGDACRGDGQVFMAAALKVCAKRSEVAVSYDGYTIVPADTPPPDGWSGEPTTATKEAG